MGFGNTIQIPVKAIRFHGFHATMIQPAVRLHSPLENGQHHLFMIAKQRNQFQLLFKLQQSVEHSFGIRPSIDVIARGHNRIGGLWLDSFKKRVERCQATVDITENDGAGHRKTNGSQLRNLIHVGLRISSQKRIDYCKSERETR